MTPHGKRTLGSGIAVGLLCTLMVGLPRAAYAADLGDEPSKSSPPSQLDDSDRPKDSILDKKPADAAVASKKAEPVGPPFYEKWQFWAVAGGIVVGVVAAVIVGQKVAHQVNGGDVRPCNMMLFNACNGQGY